MKVMFARAFHSMEDHCDHQSPKLLLALYLAIHVLLFLMVRGTKGKVMSHVIYITLKMGCGDDDYGCEDFKM